MQNTQIPLNQVVIYITIINIILGFLFGIFPLLLGIKMNNRKYGVIGFIGAIIGGGILGVFLSFPIALIFSWLIIKNFVAGDYNKETVVNEIPAEAEINKTENI